MQYSFSEDPGFAVEDVTGKIGSSEKEYCIQIPDGRVGRRSPGEDAFNLALGEPGTGLVFFQAQEFENETLNLQDRINERVGTRIRDQSEGSAVGKPVSVSISR